MTDRINSFLVILENDVREDDAEKLHIALGQLRGVVAVHPNISNPTTIVAESRAIHKLGNEIMGVILKHSS